MGDRHSLTVKTITFNCTDSDVMMRNEKIHAGFFDIELDRKENFMKECKKCCSRNI